MAVNSLCTLPAACSTRNTRLSTGACGQRYWQRLVGTPSVARSGAGKTGRGVVLATVETGSFEQELGGCLESAGRQRRGVVDRRAADVLRREPGDVRRADAAAGRRRGAERAGRDDALQG